MTAGVVEGGYRVRIVSTKCKAIDHCGNGQRVSTREATNFAKVVSQPSQLRSFRNF